MVVPTDWLKGVTAAIKLIVVCVSSGVGVGDEETNNELGGVKGQLVV